MKPIFGYVSRDALDRKPPHGEPCTRCGACCMATLCPLALRIFGQRPGPCPALVKSVKPHEYACGVVADPARFSLRQTMLHGVEKMRAAAMHLIGSGTGCDARFNGEKINEAFYDKLIEHDRRRAAETRESMKLWGL